MVRSWNEIEKHYMDLNNLGWRHERMLELILHIKSLELANRLVAFTSLDKLIIGIYDPMQWDKEALHIDFDRQQQKWLFKYYPKPNETIEFERQYAADKGIEKFDNFIKMIRW